MRASEGTRTKVPHKHPSSRGRSPELTWQQTGTGWELEMCSFGWGKDS